MGRREQIEMMEVAQGRFELSRWPDRQGTPLRAWDAADEYLLNHLHREAVPLDGTVLIVNDGFGALGTALGPEADISWGDSVVSHQALAVNLSRISRAGPVVLPGNETPTGTIDVVLLKVPKHNSLLEDQLHRLRPLLVPESTVIVAGMTKTIHTSTLQLLETILGPTRTSLAKKKARLAFTTFDPDLAPGPSPWPITWQHDGLTIVNHGGVFSARSIDIGTRFLLQNLPGGLADGAQVVDLGCGNGVVGAAVLVRNPGSSCLFVDESYAAVTSSRDTVGRSVPDAVATFAAVESLDETVEPGSIDLVDQQPPVPRQYRTEQRHRRADVPLQSPGPAVRWRAARDRQPPPRPPRPTQTDLRQLHHVAGNRKFVVMKATRR